MIASSEFDVYESIPVDFDVFKALTVRRLTAQESYNDVLRKLLGLGAAGAQVARTTVERGTRWVTKGVEFPDGTEFRARYKGKLYEAKVEDGALVYNGQRFTSPSPAAMEITGNNVNGWKFWEARRPGERQWTLIFSLWQKNQNR